MVNRMRVRVDAPVDISKLPDMRVDGFRVERRLRHLRLEGHMTRSADMEVQRSQRVEPEGPGLLIRLNCDRSSLVASFCVVCVLCPAYSIRSGREASLR